MKVVLLKDFKGIGKQYEIKDVNEGYASNFLFPKGIAEPATSSSLAKVYAYENAVKLKKEVKHDTLANNLAQIRDKKIEIIVPANNAGHLFSSIHEKDIIEVAKRVLGVIIDPKMINLDSPIKTIGEYKISIGTKEMHTTLIVDVVSKDNKK